MWLGGIRDKETKDWGWPDGRTSGYQRWSSRPSSSSCGTITKMQNGVWMKTKCDSSHSFICSIPLKRTSRDSAIVLRNPFLDYPTFHFWWNHTLSTEKKSWGFKLAWQFENRSISNRKEFVSKKLSGRVCTPGLGILAPSDFYKERHEYTAVIELPDDITDVIGC